MAPDPEQVELRAFGAGDAPWLVQRHADLYRENDGFDETFGALVAGIVEAFLADHDPATERGWVACAGDRRLGSIFCIQSGEPGVAKLRLFLLEPDARGLGLGRRLLETCLGFARQRGYASLRLWTHESHRAACALYAKNGFALVRSEPKTSFGVPVVEQEWELDLA